MRSLLLLLACVAAANASCYYTKSFSGCYYTGCYSTYECLALPCFSGRAKCPTLKCTVYKDIVYPTDACTGDSAEAAVATLVEAYKAKLLVERNTIDKDLQADKKTFTDDVDAKTNKYIADQTKIIEEFYNKKITADPDNKSCYEDAKKDAIKRITDRANARAKSAKDCYSTSVKNVLARVDNYHKCLADNYESCLTNRLTKIASYNKKIAEQMKTLKTNFKKRLEARRDCMTENFKKTLKRCYDTDVDKVVELYKAQIDKEIAVIVKKYNDLIDGNEKKLKAAYKCGLKCDGCRCIYNRKSLDLTWCVDTKITRPCARTKKYRYCSRLPQYKTCTCADKVIKKPADLDADIAKKIATAVGDAKKAMNTWISDQEKRNTDASDAFSKQIDTCHKDELTRMKTCGATDDEVNARKLEHVQEKVDLMKTFNDKQTDNFTAAKKSYSDAIDNYEKNLNKCKKSIVDAYTACLARKAKCVTDYETKLNKRVADKRKTLEDNLKTTTAKNVKCYHDFIVAFVGDANKDNADVAALVASYKADLEKKDKAKLDAYDKHWKELAPKMVISYECKLSCKCRDFTPRSFCYNPCMRQPRVCIPKKTYVKKYTYTKCYYQPCYYYGNYCKSI